MLSLNVPFCERLPEGIGKMTSLKSLISFDMKKSSLDSIKGLGELTNLSTLSLRTGLPEDVDMDVLNSSLGKLCNLESLQIFSSDYFTAVAPESLEIFPSDYWIPEALTLSPPPTNLVRLYMVRRSRVPYWIGELHNLQILRLTVEQLDKDGVGILAGLPALTDLCFKFNRSLEETIAIYGTAFAHLKRFDVTCKNMLHLNFQAGALPKLQSLSLRWNHDDNAAPTGIEHLLALERIYVEIGRGSATESEQRSRESAIRSAINMLPGHDHITINIQCEHAVLWSVGF